MPLPDERLLPLINWHKLKHPQFSGNNTPNENSTQYLQQLTSDIIVPLQKQFGTLHISYGFNSAELLRWLTKHSPKDMGPKIDQHASMELNLRGNRICKRDGAACDITLSEYENRMNEIAKFIIEHLNFDRLYYYGANRPLHVSIGPDNTRYVQFRKTKADGTRVAGQSRIGASALELFTD
ncbi:hypothetical protein [Vibrio ezurae]|uniref:Peptidase M15A C-terminal domain-containing protein n=1 Tax=Vibrio ezurae NBRC 102218 TaxID=1219080 RepID=U3CPY7_9VIBR|nr:hypothetical protein [Vibrio ezurae]GAD80233.1 hypothetical protein VEZ01S_28_00160 [Vibrio ezurae NBRC 102218]